MGIRCQDPRIPLNEGGNVPKDTQDQLGEIQEPHEWDPCIYYFLVCLRYFLKLLIHLAINTVGEAIRSTCGLFSRGGRRRSKKIIFHNMVYIMKNFEFLAALLLVLLVGKYGT